MLLKRVICTNPKKGEKEKRKRGKRMGGNLTTKERRKERNESVGGLGLVWV